MPMRKPELVPCKYNCGVQVNPKSDPVQAALSCGMCCPEAKAEREEILKPIAAAGLKRAEERRKQLLDLVAAREKARSDSKPSARK